MSNKRSILGNRFEFTGIVEIFLATVLFLGSGASVSGQNATVPNNVNETIIDDYDNYGQPIYYNEDNGNYYYKDDSENAYNKDENGNNYYTNAQGHHYWYDNDGHKSTM